MDTFEREAQREKESLSTANQKSYDYTGKNAGELARMVEERDRKIAMLEKHIHEYKISIPNYPSCYPMIHIDIDTDVPARRRMFCRMLLIGWYVTIMIIVANLISMFIASQSENKDAEVNQDKWEESQWLSIAWLLGIPVAFPLWFYSSYSALVTGKQMRYNIALIGLLIGVLGSIFAVIGLLGFGTCGIFTMFRAKDDKGNTAFLCVLAVCIAWCCKVVFLIVGLFKMWRYKREDARIATISEQAASMLARAVVDNA